MGNVRRVWNFFLKVKDRDHFSINLTLQRGLEKEKEKKAKKLSIEELKKRESSTQEFHEIETLKQRPMRGPVFSLNLEKEGQEEGVNFVQ